MGRKVVAAHLGWPSWKINRAVKLGCPAVRAPSGRVRGFEPEALKAWAEELESHHEIHGLRELTEGWWFAEPGSIHKQTFTLFEHNKRAEARWVDGHNECMGWDTKRDRELGPHYRVSIRKRRGKDRLVVRCGKCLEERIDVLVSEAWPVTLVVPQESKP